MAILLPALFSCKKENSGTPSNVLSFSTDTLVFDTVFTALGGTTNPRSANLQLRVRNTGSQPIETSIRLAGGTASPFRMNVDGFPTLDIQNYRIRGNDSIYIFVEVTIDPLNSNNPLIVQDSIIFNTGGNVQQVQLVAWGQDAYYFEDSILACNVVWADRQKPYVIYNSILVPENCKLTIGPGVRIHSAPNSQIFVLGTLEILGTKEERTTLQGARLGKDFEDIPGQWGGIRLLTRSRNNRIEFADIKNAIIGVQVDSAHLGNGPKLQIRQTAVKNMSAAGIVGYTANILAENLLAANCGQFTFVGELGGTYNLLHCTFADLGTTFSRQRGHFYLANTDYDDGQGTVVVNPLTFNIVNSIIWGHLRDELRLMNTGQGTITPFIGHTILKTQQQGLNVNDNLLNIDPRLKDPRAGDYSLDTLSPAQNRGNTLSPPISIDLLGESRDIQPDLGAYERKE